MDRSKDILGDMSQPRIFSLQKLVEVADFNMDSRGRIVWANVWGVLSHHFSALGAHSNRYVRKILHQILVWYDVLTRCTAAKSSVKLGCVEMKFLLKH